MLSPRVDDKLPRMRPSPGLGCKSIVCPYASDRVTDVVLRQNPVISRLLHAPLRGDVAGAASGLRRPDLLSSTVVYVGVSADFRLSLPGFSLGLQPLAPRHAPVRPFAFAHQSKLSVTIIQSISQGRPGELEQAAGFRPVDRQHALDMRASGAVPIALVSAFFRRSVAQHTVTRKRNCPHRQYREPSAAPPPTRIEPLHGACSVPQWSGTSTT